MSVQSLKPLRLNILTGQKPVTLKARMLRLFNQGKLILETPAKMQEALTVFKSLESVPGLKDEAFAALKNAEIQIEELKAATEKAAAPPHAPPPTRAEEVLETDAVGALVEVELIEQLETCEKPADALAALTGLATIDKFESPIRLLVATLRWIGAENEIINKAISQIHDKLPATNYIMTGVDKAKINIEADGVFGNIFKGRRPNQEDGFACFEVNGKKYYLIADGMGGHAGGEIASEIALVETMIAVENGAGLEAAIRIAHKKVYEFSQEFAASYKTKHNKDLDNPPGSTIAAIEIDGDIVRTVHAGDSKIYLAKEDGRILLLTFPHSLVAELVESELQLPIVQAVFGEEVIDKLESYKNAPHASRITSGLGTDENIKTLTTHKVVIEPGDRLFACSDGLESLPFQTIKEILTDRNGESVEVLGRRLAEASEKSKPRDNSTFFLVEKIAELEEVEASTDPSTRIGDLKDLAGQSADPAISGLMDQVASLKQQLAAAETDKASLSGKLRATNRTLKDHQAAIEIARKDEYQLPYYIKALEAERAELLERGKNISGGIARLEAENESKIIGLQAALGDKSLEISGAQSLIATRKKDYEDQVAAQSVALARDLTTTEYESLWQILQSGHETAVASIKERMDNDPVIVELLNGLAGFEAEKESMQARLIELQGQARVLEEAFAALEGEVVTFYKEKIAAPLTQLRNQGTALKLAWMDTDFENGKG